MTSLPVNPGLARRIRRQIQFEVLSAPGVNRLEACIVLRRGQKMRTLKWFGVIFWDETEEVDWELVRDWVRDCRRSAIPYLRKFRSDAIQQKKGSS